VSRVLLTGNLGDVPGSSKRFASIGCQKNSDSLLNVSKVFEKMVKRPNNFYATIKQIGKRLADYWSGNK
jgi:hypothetical protein